MFNKIDGICIGPYDHFNMKDYLKQNYNFKIIMYNSNNIKSLFIFPIFLNSFILDKNIPEIFNKIINYKIVPKDINILEFGLDIRTCSRKLLNMFPLYVNIINYIYDKYNSKYKIKIYFLGRFSTNTNTIKCENDVEYIEQNNLVLQIMNKVNNNDILFENLLGQHFSSIFNKTMNTIFNICIAGTSITNLMWLVYHKKSVCLSCRSMYVLAYDFINVLQNYNVIFPPIEYITDSDNLNFFVDGSKFLQFLSSILLSYGL